MIDDALKSIKSYLYDRAVSPLMGSFLVSWCTWNYRLILAFFSDVSILEKFRIIDEVLFENGSSILWYGVIYPLVTALGYIFIYPYPAKLVFEFSRKRQKEINNIKKTIEEETLLTVEESRSIRHEVYNLEDEFQKEISRKNIEIERLKIDIETLSSPSDQKSLTGKEILEKIDATSNDELDSEQIEILKLIGLKPNGELEKNILSAFKAGHLKAKYHLGELEKQGYLERDYDQSHKGYRLTLSHRGRALLVRNGHA
jgi:hypothetical protein